MSLQLDAESASFVSGVLSDAQDLLDNVHCYDAPVYDEINVALKILDGLSLKDAIAKHAEENSDG